jgi:tRNA(fMet)-specific endonuclease VapC
VKFLLDTNICIYIINNRFEGSTSWIINAGIENVCVSSISVAELEFGITKSTKFDETQTALYKFLSGFNLIDFDAVAARSYGRIRADLQSKGNIIGAMDMLIAATAISNEMILISNNVGEFSRVKGLKIENWVETPP